jgi:hypothetical protein
MRVEELELSAATTVDLCPPPAARSMVIGDAPATSRVKHSKAWLFPVLLGSILLIGILLRLFLPAGFKGIGFDENLYRAYVTGLDEVGLQNYPALVDAFIANQEDPHNQAILPPTRVLYIVGGYFYHHAFGLGALSALRTLSCHFAILTFLISALFCWRLTRQKAFTATVTGLMACAATQIHLGQHALIDGVFGFWALLVIWLLWESLRHPGSIRWLLGYGAALAALVMTKESAVFVLVAVLGILMSNRWLKFGSVSRGLIVATFAGAAVGLAVVIAAAGGVEQFVLVFELLKQKVPILPYTIRTGGGPWHRYLIDLMLVSPLVVLLAATNLLAGRPQESMQRYLLAFCCLVYGVLTAFPGGMNLRYIVMLDMPLRFLAATQLFVLSSSWGKRRNLLLACAVVALCAYDLRQHYVLYVKGGLYELVTEGLVRAQGIIK